MGFAQLHRNTGPWGVVRAVALPGLFLVIAVTLLVHESSWLPLAAVVGGAALPIPLRQRMVDHVDALQPWLKTWAILLVGGAATSPLWKDRAPEWFLRDEVSLSALLLIATLYMSVWICLNSHPDITTRRSRGE